jgi:uncharacterized protein YjbI with pentapeptide repeats
MTEQINETIMNKCSVCGNEFDDKYVDSVQNKCILHCEKDDWYEVEENEKDWSKSDDKIELFWQQVRKIIQNRETDYEYTQGKSLDFSQTIFPKFENQYTMTEQFDDETVDVIDWHDNFCNTNITNSQSPSFDLEIRLDFSYSIFLDDVNFDYYEFKEHISFNNVQFKGEFHAQKTIFDSVSFHKVNFFKSVVFEDAKVYLFARLGDFENTTFHDEAIFYSSNFSKKNTSKIFDIDFKGTKFKKVSFNSCNFKQGLRFHKDTKADHLEIQNMNLPELYIAGDIKNIYIRGNNKKIDKLTIKHLNLENLLIHNCIVGSDFLLNDKLWKKDEIFGIKNLNLAESTFQGKVKIQFYEISEKANFYNTKFKDLADFYRTKFNKVVFKRTDFEKVAVFSEAVFNQDVNFKYAKFLGYSVFRDTIIKGKLDLRNTIFDTDADANFLDITSEERSRDEETQEFYGEPKVIQVANRETARIIKNFYEHSNNIIEANKFYALEMKEREKELNKDSQKGKNILEWLIFKIHNISSEHSQSWFLSLFWIVYFTIMYSFLSKFHDSHTTLLNSIITLTYFEVSLIIGLYIDSIKSKTRVISGIIIALMSYSIYGASSNDFALNCFSKNINPFSIMKGSDSITFGELIFKITTAYLIYQFIVSVRQNTRRK